MGIESTIRGLDPAAIRPWSDLVEPAWLTCPSLIKNRVELLRSACNSYDELARSLRRETANLGHYWRGPAATLFDEHQAETARYLGDIQARAQQLVEEGDKAVDVLRLLRNAYAAIGYEYISLMIERQEEYHAASTSAFGQVAECTTPGGAAQALMEVVQVYNTALANERRRSVEAAVLVLGPERVVMQERPDFGRTFDTVPFPRDELASAGVWQQSDHWTAVSLDEEGSW